MDLLFKYRWLVLEEDSTPDSPAYTAWTLKEEVGELEWELGLVGSGTLDKRILLITEKTGVNSGHDAYTFNFECCVRRVLEVHSLTEIPLKLQFEFLHWTLLDH